MILTEWWVVLIAVSLGMYIGYRWYEAKTVIDRGMDLGSPKGDYGSVMEIGGDGMPQLVTAMLCCVCGRPLPDNPPDAAMWGLNEDGELEGKHIYCDLHPPASP